jgi:hypothetical protein
MAKIAAKRVTARIDGDFVVFLIGMRINKPWTVITSLGVIVQHWRSFEHLEAYARDHRQLHLARLGGLQ